VIWRRYCGTAAKADGNGENKLLPAVTGDSCLLEKDELMAEEWSNGWIDVAKKGEAKKEGSAPMETKKMNPSEKPTGQK